MTEKWERDPTWVAWKKRIVAELVPMIEDSAVVMSLVPKGPPDIKYAVELGLSIMLDKPIIAVVTPGVQVPERLLRVADEIVEADLDDAPGTALRIKAAMDRITAK